MFFSGSCFAFARGVVLLLLTSWWCSVAEAADCCTQCKNGVLTYNGKANLVLDTSVCANSVVCNDGCARLYGYIGTYLPEDQCLTCTYCQPGKYCANLQRYDCPRGSYQDQYAATFCKSCASGATYQDVAGALSCKACGTCRAGQVTGVRCGLYSDVVCQECFPGTYSASPTDTGCARCPDGTYQGQYGQTSCSQWVGCPAGQMTSRAGTATNNVQCAACTGDWSTVSGSQTSCSSCVAGKYRVNVNGALTCQTCVCTGYGGGAEVYMGCGVGSTSLQCPACSFTTAAGGYCQKGMEPDVARCDGTQTRDVVCVNCPAGKHKPTANQRSCEACGAGYYKVGTSTADCVVCTNKNPGRSQTVAVYDAWGSGAVASSNSCPWSCVAGYYKTGSTSKSCASCFTVIGKYSLAGATVCSSCSNKPANSVYLMPSANGFNGASNNCPWECNAGYRKHVENGLSTCASCSSGDYRAAETLTESSVPTPCRPCSVCGNEEYQSTACTTTQNRRCVACKSKCGAGQRITAACSALADMQCVACQTRCPAQKYLSGQTCPGTTTNDVVVDSCLPCKTVDQCPEGTFLSGDCVGSETMSNECRVCSKIACGTGFYSGGCGGYSDTRCIPYRTCQAGEFLNLWGASNDGVCQTCRNCAAFGLQTVTACSRYKNAGCGGEPCNETAGCLSTANVIHYCDYLDNPLRPTCGICPVRSRIPWS